MHNTVVIPYVSDKRFQLVRPQEVFLETAGRVEPLPEGFPESLSTLYRSVQNRLRWGEVSPEYRFISDFAFDILSLVPEELKEQDFQDGQPAIQTDCCQLLGAKGEVLLKIQRREVLYICNDEDSTEIMVREGTSVRDAIRQCVDNTVYAVLYCQYLYGQLTAAILHIDRNGEALRLPESPE